MNWFSCLKNFTKFAISVSCLFCVTRWDTCFSYTTSHMQWNRREKSVLHKCDSTRRYLLFWTLWFYSSIIMTPWVVSTWISSSMHFNPKISTFISQFHNHAQYLKVNNSGRPLDNQTWHTNGSPQQKLPKSGFRTRLTALWPMEQSSILSAKFHCPVARIVKLPYSPNLFSWKYLNILLEESIVKETLITQNITWQLFC